MRSSLKVACLFVDRYAGLYWTKPDNYDKMDCKGIETVRRDNCQLVANLINTCLQKILMERYVLCTHKTKLVVEKRSRTGILMEHWNMLSKPYQICYATK